MKRVGLVITVISLIAGQVVTALSVSAVNLTTETSQVDQTIASDQLVDSSLDVPVPAPPAPSQLGATTTSSLVPNDSSQDITDSADQSSQSSTTGDEDNGLPDAGDTSVDQTGVTDTAGSAPGPDQGGDQSGQADPPVDPPLAQELLISKLQVGLDGNSSAEFIEIYNPSPEAVLLDDWQLEYLMSSFDPAEDQPEVLLTINDIELAGRGFLVITNQGYLDEQADLSYGNGSNVLAQNGSLRLSRNGQVVDLVGWGSASQYLGSPAAAEKYGSIERCIDGQLQVVDSRDNQLDFAVYDWPSALPVFGLLAACPDDELPDDPDVVVNPCLNLILSELATNVDRQFIEIYNQSDQAVDLKGCQLSSRKHGQLVVLGGIEVAAHQYEAVYLDDHQVQLYKTVDDTVYLLSSDDSEVDKVDYDGLDEGTAWALVDGQWSQTYQPTPYQSNIAQPYQPCQPGQQRNPLTNRCVMIDQSDGDLKPCAADQERNPLTNRCRKTATLASQLVPCQPGQFRNPATNRCKSMTTASALVPCDPDQERNPETNRCRKIGSSVSQLKPCADGYERNPETNRCRKVRGAIGEVAGYAVEPIADSAQSTLGWWAFGGVALLAAGYGTWEWRHEISRLIRGLAGFGRH